MADALRVAQRKQAQDAHAKSIALMGFLSQVARRLGVAESVYVVGGAVRNFILDMPIKDIDVVIDAVALGGQKDSDWFAKKLSQAIPTSTNVVTNQYGVAILTVKGPWVLDGNDLRGEVIEIANARKESYGGSEGKGYKPSEVIPATIEEDVYRREFTFNTLLWRLLDLANGPDKAEIIDLTGCGLRDLEERQLKCPRDPDVVFADDPTRLMRAIKFVAKYGFKIPPDLAASIQRNAGKMKGAPWEAIGTLLVENVLNEPTAFEALKLMKKLGLLDVIAEMVQEQKPFAAYLAGQLKDRKVAMLLNLMDLGIDVRSPISFLTREQQERLRQVTTPMPEGQAEEFLERLKKVPLNNMALIEAFEIPKQERGVLSTRARDLMLGDPSLAFDANALQNAMEAELGRVYRTAGAVTAAPKKYSDIDFKPPESVAKAAEKGLELRQKASPSNKGGLTSEEAGKAGIGSGVQRAVNLKNRDEVSPETIRMMNGFFSRHEKNKSIAAENKSTPWNDKGYVAWLLWGGDPGQSWAQKVVKQMDAADEKAKGKKASGNEPTNQKLWDKVLSLTKGEVKSITHNGKTIEGPNGGKGFDIYPSAYSNGWAAKTYKSLGGGWKKESSLTASWGSTLIEARGQSKKDVGKGGLDEWFSGHGGDKGDATWGDWVSISPVTKTLPSGKKVEKGDIVGPCGISDDPDWKEFTEGGKDPLKCMPRNKAHDMPKNDRAEKAVKKMREEKKDKSKGKSPTRTPTFKDKKADADGSYMTVQGLRGLEEHSAELLEKIDEQTPLDDWVEALISQAATKIESVYEFMEHGKGSKLAEAEAIPGGRAKGKKPSDFDAKQLEMGIAVEKEHLIGDGHSPKEMHDMAQEIAMDHLTEIPDYYSRLKKMESDAGVKEARSLSAAWGDTLAEGVRGIAAPSGGKVAKTYNRLVMFDFDGTLFRSWEATPDWWKGSDLDTGPFSFFVQPESLDEPCVPDSPGSVFWIQKPLSEAKQAIADRGTLTVLITGRIKTHKQRVLDLVRQKGLNFDRFYFNPGMSAARFKIVVLKNLLVGFNTISAVEIWENENQKAYDSAMKATAEALVEERGDLVSVKVHHVHVPPKELECGPEDFNLPSQNHPQESEMRTTFTASGQRFETLEEWGSRLASDKTAAVTGDGTSVGFFIPIPEALAFQFPSLAPRDDSPPHITFMYVGGVPKDQQDQFLAVAREAFAQIEGPVKAALTGVDIFQGQDGRVAYSKVRFSQDLIQAHDKVKKYLEANGIVVAHSFPFLTPHATLAYMESNQVWEGPAPTGSWVFDRIQVWGLPKLEEVGLGVEIVNLPDEPEMGPRKFARLTHKRAQAARLRSAWGGLLG